MKQHLNYFYCLTGYVDSLMWKLFHDHAEDATALSKSLPRRYQERPQHLAAQMYHPTPEEAAASRPR